MAKEKTPNTHVEKLEGLKNNALEARRAAGNPSAVKDAQEQIEAIDRAIKSENMLAAKPSSWKGAV